MATRRAPAPPTFFDYSRINPNTFGDLTIQAKMNNFLPVIRDYVRWLDTNPPRTTAEENALRTFKEMIDDDAVFALMRATEDIPPLTNATRGYIFRFYPASTARGWLFRKLWHRLPLDDKSQKTRPYNYEEMLAIDMHWAMITYNSIKGSIDPEDRRIAKIRRNAVSDLAREEKKVRERRERAEAATAAAGEEEESGGEEEEAGGEAAVVASADWETFDEE